ncbi:hypothetical protein AB3662_01560 [Sorangium cellulosum]|uniref:hypothetical protein n=1 Tax=Sorangium cellulosum TaxID=56 RepID=UPI003D9A4F81
MTLSSSKQPLRVSVPGTSSKQGLASIVIVSGDDANGFTLAMTQDQPGAQIQCFIGSVKMPLCTDNITNAQLPADGQRHPFNTFTRYYAVPASHWYEVQIQSDKNQFISVQFSEQSAVIYVVNMTAQGDPTRNIYYMGQTKSQCSVQTSQTQKLIWEMQGNGEQFVWINADSVQNSENASIVLQSLSGSATLRR